VGTIDDPKSDLSSAAMLTNITPAKATFAVELKPRRRIATSAIEYRSGIFLPMSFNKLIIAT